MLRLIVFAIILSAAGWSAYWIGHDGARAIERMLRVRAQDGLALLGLDWARVEVDGLRVSLYGHAPDTLAQELARDTVAAIVRPAALSDRTTATILPGPPRQPPHIEIYRDEDGLTVIGRFHGDEDRDLLYEALAKAYPKTELHRLAGGGAADPGAAWRQALGVAATAVAMIENASVTADPDAVAVLGLAPDPDTRDRIETALRSQAGTEVELQVELRTPARVIAPFQFEAERSADGRLRVLRCAAADGPEARMIEGVAGRAGASEHAGICETGLGRPDRRWRAAIEAGLDALRQLPAGRLFIEYRAVTLEARPPTSETAVEPVLTRLIGALPKGYALARGDGGARTAANGGERPYWLRIDRHGRSTVVAGLVAGEAERRAVETFAAALFGAGNVVAALDVSDGPAPARWQEAVLSVMSALESADRATLDVTGHEVSIEGTVGGPEQAVALHRELATALPTGFRLHSALTVDLPAAVAAVPVSAARCAVVLNRIVARRQISFAAGSAVIEDASADELAEMARTLTRCPAARIEVAGFTDSQGPEEFNLRLSQARAAAVAAALVRGGASARQLVPRGYGEADPVASNDTPEGRARNRRIAFLPLE